MCLDCRAYLLVAFMFFFFRSLPQPVASVLSSLAAVWALPSQFRRCSSQKHSQNIGFHGCTKLISPRTPCTIRHTHTSSQPLIFDTKKYLFIYLFSLACVGGRLCIYWFPHNCSKKPLSSWSPAYNYHRLSQSHSSLASPPPPSLNSNIIQYKLTKYV